MIKKKCIICDKHVVVGEGERYCNSCRSKATKNDSDYYSFA